MKKIFTLLAFLVVAVNVAAQYNGYLNVGDPEDYGFNANETPNYEKGVIEQGRLNVCGQFLYNYYYNEGIGWIDRGQLQYPLQSTNTTSTLWNKTGVFKGSSYFYSSSPQTASNTTGNVYRPIIFYIKNCIQIDIFLYHTATSTQTNYRTFSIKAYPYDLNGFSNEPEKQAEETLTKKQAYFSSLSGLDSKKIYKIELLIPGNTHFQEISFLVNNFKPTVTNIDGNNWGTMYLDYPVRIPNNEHSTLHAYSIVGIDDNQVTLGEVSDYIPANTGVLLWEEEPNDKPIIFTETGKNIAEIGENWLKGTTEATSVETVLANKSKTAKVLTLGRNSSNKLGFFIYNGTLGANKAYLLYDYGTDAPINVKGFYISGFDELTGIQTVESESTETGNWYSLQGVRLNARPTQRGIYLNNGKKVFVK